MLLILGLVLKRDCESFSTVALSEFSVYARVSSTVGTMTDSFYFPVIMVAAD